MTRKYDLSDSIVTASAIFMHILVIFLYITFSMHKYAHLEVLLSVM